MLNSESVANISLENVPCNNKSFYEMTSKTLSTRTDSGYNLILRIVCILVAKLLKLDYLFSLAISPVTEHNLIKLDFEHIVNKSVLYPNYYPIIRPWDGSDRKKDKYLEVLNTKYSFLDEKDKNDLTDFIINISADDFIKILEAAKIKNKFSEILTNNKELVTKQTEPFLYTYLYEKISALDVVGETVDRECEYNTFNFYIDVEGYNKFNLLIDLLSTKISKSKEEIEAVVLKHNFGYTKLVGGGTMHHKYAKYKSKYLILKNKTA